MVMEGIYKVLGDCGVGCRLGQSRPGRVSKRGGRYQKKQKCGDNDNGGVDSVFFF